MSIKIIIKNLNRLICIIKLINFVRERQQSSSLLQIVMASQMSQYTEFSANYQSINKQNNLILIPQQPEADQVLLKQFRTLKQINRILDSHPQTSESKDQKIRSLTIILKKQMDVTKKLQTEVFNLNKKLQGKQQEEQMLRNQNCLYEKKIFQQKQRLISLQNENKRLLKLMQSGEQEIKVREQFIQKMKQSFNNQKNSMENQIHYLKMKNLDHFNKRQRSNSIKKAQSGKKEKQITNKQNNSSSKSKKQNIIQRNILAISKNQNEIMSGKNMLQTFSNKKQLVQRLDEIRRGNYSSALDGRFNF